MSFKKELQEKLGEHNPTEVDELILDDLFENIQTFTDDHKKSLELYKNLLHISLNGFGLTSLKNFPRIETLQVLQIRQNKLTGTDFGEIQKLYPNLEKLKVGENEIKSLDVFKTFITSSLKKLELLDNPVSNNETYRDELFKTLKNVEVIDKLNREGDEVDSTLYDDEEGEEYDDDYGDDDGEDFEDAEDFEDDEDEDEDEEEMPKNNKKQRRE